jgi:hypothetical protein
MSLALTSAWFRAGAGVEAIVAGLREVGLPHLHLERPDPAARGWREALTRAGVTVVSVGADPDAGAADAGTRFATALAVAIETASALKAKAVVVEGGRFPGPAGARLADLDRALARVARGSGDDAAKAREESLRLRGVGRERLVEGAARALHAALKDGVPLTVRNGDGLAALLGFEETGWLLSALPRLQLFFDPARAERAARLATGPALVRWTDAHAARVAGVAAHGLGSDLAGRAHPEDAGPDWGSLGDTLPRGRTWVLDVSGTLSAADVRDAVRFLRASGALDEPGGGRRPS